MMAAQLPYAHLAYTASTRCPILALASERLFVLSESILGVFAAPCLQPRSSRGVLSARARPCNRFTTSSTAQEVQDET